MPTSSEGRERWSVDRARDWWGRQAWPVGCNFIPSSAVNQLEMWQADTFELEIIRRELDMAAGLGFKLVRVYLHDLVWQHERAGLLDRIDVFLAAASQAGLGVMFVLFDDCWNPDPRPGRQPEPHPSRHNSGWVQSPGRAALLRYPEDAGLRERLESYTRGLISAFARDERVLLWDLYNEPGALPIPSAQPVGSACLPLLRDVFRWARAVDAQQPLTSGLWSSPGHEADPRIRAAQLTHSDIVSFHHYGPAEALRALCGDFASETRRPLLCTEFMARAVGSRFETHLPIFQELGIGAVGWGLVSGKTQTLHPWWSWLDEQPKPEPKQWFHDILRPDGTPFDAAEVHFLRSLLLDGSS